MDDVRATIAATSHVQYQAVDHDLRWPRASIHTIPPEILSNVFKLGRAMREDELEDEVDKDNVDDIDDMPMPFEILVTHVNSHFRKTALNTHSLWSSIHIWPRNSVNKVAEYVERSGRHKLDVQIDLLHPGYDAKIQQMISLVLPHSFRWRTLYYRSVDEVQGNSVLSHIADLSAPVLEELSLSIDEMQMSGHADASQRPIFRGGAPRLSFVRLRGFVLYSLLPPLSAVRILHLDQTKSLALGYPMFRQILSAVAHLEHLSIYGDMVPDSAWPSVIHFPRLTSLRICDVCGGAYASLLLGFDTPALTTLALKGVQEHDLERLWSAGNPPMLSKLERLTFCDCGLLEHDWRQFFRLFAGVTHFSLYSSKTTSTVLQLLAGSNPELPWPHLKSLSIIIDDSDEILIREVVAARESGGHPLEVVRLGKNEDDDKCSDGTTRIAYFKHPDRWPPNHEFRDWDYNLFL